MIDRDSTLSIRRQCELLGPCRSSLYYRLPPISAADVLLMRRRDELHLTDPFLVARRLVRMLRREAVDVGRRPVATPMLLMGLEAISRKTRTSLPDKRHRIYPYVLPEVIIERPNQLWATNATYPPMAEGFAPLVAILDLSSHKVLAFRVSNTRATDCCIEAPEEALRRYSAPEIFNTDQGAANSPTRTPPRFWTPRAFASPWTARGAGPIMRSSAGGGGASHTRAFTSTPTRLPGR
jgi:putative transposase